MLGWIVRIAIETGMRSSEIASLRRSKVNVARRVVRLSNTKDDGSRTVPLSLVATDTLQRALLHPIRPIDTNLVFLESQDAMAHGALTCLALFGRGSVRERNYPICISTTCVMKRQADLWTVA